MKLSTLILFAFFANLPLLGNIITVTSLDDTGAAGDLRYAIALANNGDSIVFVVSGTITLNSPLNIGVNLTIDGSAGVSINGNSGTIFNVTGASTDLFSNLALVNATDAITGSSSASISVVNSTLTGNDNGLAGVNATVTNSTLAGNTAAISGGTVLVVNSTLSNNTDGIVNANATVTNSSFAGNTDAAISGGTVSALGSTFLDNAGGLVNASGTATNSTFADNTAAIDGGSVSLYDSTVSGGTFGSENSSLTIGNSIIDGNTTDVDSGTVVTDLGHNLIGSGGPFTNGVDGDIVGANAGLAPLGNYGGPTLTYALVSGSPAINGGNNAIIPSGVTTDQLGSPRIYDGTVDIGAYEDQDVPEPATCVTCLLAFAMGARRLGKIRK